MSFVNFVVTFAMRTNGRKAADLRPLSFELGYLKFADGSCLARAGDTHVLAAASFEASVPAWLEGKEQGWITAEYAMLPASTPGRNPRESRKGRPSARSQEISRLIGRSLRMGFDLGKLGENLLIVDCDVLQADGGTRTLSICAGFCALYDALRNLQDKGFISRIPLRQFVAAISVGIVDGQVMVDFIVQVFGPEYFQVTPCFKQFGKPVLSGFGKQHGSGSHHFEHAGGHAGKEIFVQHQPGPAINNRRLGG